MLPQLLVMVAVKAELPRVQVEAMLVTAAATAAKAEQITQTAVVVALADIRVQEALPLDRTNQLLAQAAVVGAAVRVMEVYRLVRAAAWDCLVRELTAQPGSMLQTHLHRAPEEVADPAAVLVATAVCSVDQVQAAKVVTTAEVADQVVEAVQLHLESLAATADPAR